METPLKYRLHNSVLYQMTLTSRMQERRLEEGLRTLGLTRITWCVLAAVEFENCTQPSEIAEYIGIDRSATSRALRGLEGSGLLERVSGAPDRRTTRVKLTAAGRELVLRAAPIAEDNSRYFLGKLTAAEVRDLARIMGLMREGESRSLPKF